MDFVGGSFLFLSSFILQSIILRKPCQYKKKEIEEEHLFGSFVEQTVLAVLHKKEQDLYLKLHPKSLQKSKSASEHFFLGVPMPWMSRVPGPFPLCIDDAKGAHFVDADGFDYVDYCLGDTGAMAGHALQKTAEALYSRAKRGITTMSPSSDLECVGKELAMRFGLPLWQFAMSATDANRFVLKYSRMLTKRHKIAIFDWCYHGTIDETFATLDSETGEVIPRPGTIPPSYPLSQTTRVAHFNDLDGLEEILSHGDVACLMMEPALTNCGIVLPSKGYSAAVRALTRKYGVLLALDETHTICAGPGGCTHAWGLEPDFFIIGKPIGGGMPAAAYGFTKEIGAALAQQDCEYSVGGTLTGNAMAVAAVRTTLENSLREEDFEVSIPLAAAWAKGVQHVIDEFGLPWSVLRIGCRCEYWFSSPASNGAQAIASSCKPLADYLHLFALNRGVMLTPFSNMALLCPYHTIEDVDKHTKVFRESLMSIAEAMKSKTDYAK